MLKIAHMSKVSALRLAFMSCTEINTICKMNSNLFPLDYKKMYNPMHLEFGKSKYWAYDGVGNCGNMSIIVLARVLGLQLLEPHEIRVKMSEFIIHDHKLKHIYLKVKSTDARDIIIDPTYRQFMRHNVWDHLDLSGDSYQSYVYQKLPKFFVGTIDELEAIYTRAHELQIARITKNPFLEKAPIYWKDSIDITEHAEEVLSKFC